MRKLSFAASSLFFLSVSFASTAPSFADSPLSNLALTAKTRSIEIEDNWMGLSEFGPVGRHYYLKPAGEAFEGKAVFSLGGGPNVKTKEVPVSVPKDAIQKFLTLLSQSALEKGVYTPKIDHTDDYPSVRMIVEGDAGKVEFFSRSQGDFAVPWGVAMGTETFVVNMKAPGEALALLQPYFKQDGLKALMDEWRAQNQKRR